MYLLVMKVRIMTTIRLSSFRSEISYDNVTSTLHGKLRNVNPKFAKWAQLGRGMRYTMPSTCRYDTSKRRQHMTLIILKAQINLMKSERNSMTTWVLIGFSLNAHVAPLGLPRSALCGWQVTARVWVTI
jgi:hypothetical protein